MGISVSERNCKWDVFSQFYGTVPAVPYGREFQYRLHTLIKGPMHAQSPMQMTARAFCKMRGLAAGLGVMLVDEGGADGEGGGGSACNSVELQLVGVLRRG